MVKTTKAELIKEIDRLNEKYDHQLLVKREIVLNAHIAKLREALERIVSWEQDADERIEIARVVLTGEKPKAQTEKVNELVSSTDYQDDATNQANLLALLANERDAFEEREIQLMQIIKQLQAEIEVLKFKV